MDLKPYYKLTDFVDLVDIKTRQNYTAECPCCKKHHLSISKKSGLFHCFTPECNFNGICDDFKDPQYQHKEEWQKEPKKKNTDYAILDVKLSSIKSNPAVVKYLADQQIPLEVAEQAGCMSAVRNIDGIAYNCLCYVNRLYGSIINVKYRAVTEKKFTQDVQPKDKNVPSAPYNIECLNPLRPSQPPAPPLSPEQRGQKSFKGGDPPLDAKLGAADSSPFKGDRGGLLIITEGEKDVLTLLSAGYETVISTPNGASAKPEECFAPFVQWLKGIRRVLICGDNDDAGEVMKHNYLEYFEKLGKKCAIATLSHGCKDISECRQKFGLDEVHRIVDTAPFPPNRDILRIRDMRQKVLSVVHGEYDHGYSIGYGEYTNKHLHLTDEGGLIILTGKPNSGKTDWLRCTMTRLMLQLQKGCVFCSFEEPNKEKHIRRLLQIAFGTTKLKDVPDSLINAALDILDQRMAHLLMEDLAPSPTNIIAQTQQLIDDGMPVHFLCIDPYLFLVSDEPRESETQQIKSMLTTLQKWGRQHHVWVCVVAHPRKLIKDGTTGEYEEIDQYTISGSAHWANLADFLISIKRVFPFAKGNEDEGSANPSYTVADVLKVRDQEFCSTGRLYYHRQPCGRYDERRDAEACKRELSDQPPVADEVRVTDTEVWGKVKG